MTRLVAVDDDPYFLSLVQAAAQQLGLEVHPCGTVAAALRALEQPTDLLLVDGVLPDGSGEKLIERILKRPPPRPRIAFVSAFFKDLRSYQRLRGLGAELVLHKPVSAAHLRAELAGLMAEPVATPKAAPEPIHEAAVKLRELAQDYAQTFPKRRAELVDALATAGATRDARPIGTLSHRLAGTAGSYGYLAISDAASGLEQAVDRDAPLEEISTRVQTVLAMLERQAGGLEQLPSDLLSARWLRQLVVVGPTPLRASVASGLSARGLGVRFASTRSELLEGLQSGVVDAAVVADSHASRDCISLIAELTPQGCPIVLLGDPGPLPVGRHPSVALASEAGPDAVLAACRSLAPARFRGHSVLLVEDDPEIPRLVRTLLEPFGIMLHEARDLVECRELAMDPVPSVALIDARLPVWSGFEVCRHLRADERLDAMPILMLSSSSTPVDRLAAVEAGTSDYLLKPIVGVELAARVLDRIRDRERATLRRAQAEAAAVQPDSPPSSQRESQPPRWRV